MKYPFLLSGCLVLGQTLAAPAEEDTAALRKELDALRNDYERRIDRLESKIHELEAAPAKTPAAPVRDVEMEAAREREAIAKRQQEQIKRAVDARFEQNTETRDFRRRADDDNMVSERIENVLDGYMDINGYFRAGYGRSDNDGPMAAFGAPGVAKYRLGNEAENYGELAFSKTFYPAGVFGSGKAMDQNDPVAQMVYRMSIYNPYANYGAASATEFASPEIWGSLGNVIPGMPEASLWAGSRFYRRHDININDFYYWDMSGGGGGIEDVTFGPGKFALAWIGDGAESAIYASLGEPTPNNLAGFSKSSFDLRYYDWKFLGGTGEAGLVYAKAGSGVDSSGRQADDSQGFSFSLLRTDKGFLDPDSLHTTGIQVGNGPAKTFTSGFETFTDSTGTYIRPDPDDSWRVRFTDQVVINPIDQFSLGTALVYQYTDYGEDAPEQQWVSGGLRPIWHFNEVFSLAFEGGMDWISGTSFTGGGSVTKLTLAPQVSLGDKFLSRPVLRAFVTYAAWSDGLEGKVGGADYIDSTDGWSWGMQMETWW
ncbi:MAG: carbohydrate porin [Luteolibacter sp.]|uniref:carbohydrate porin n=1 Tax=Luteolibacter sp. TaxID=1962973 RepID=UPI0032664735